MMRSFFVLALLMVPKSVVGFAVGSNNKALPKPFLVRQQAVNDDDSAMMNRRESLFVLGAIGMLAVPKPALAEIADETPRTTTRMGGLLERYQDSSRGWMILAPSGWNRFDGEVGAYDVKWQDLVDPKENIKVSSTPVKSTTTSVDVLGDVKALGESLASKRNAKLIGAEERLTEGVVFYTFDFAINDGTHQLLQLCVNKGRIWSLDANTTEKRFSKREELYRNVLGSFLPKLS